MAAEPTRLCPDAGAESRVRPPDVLVELARTLLGAGDDRSLAAVETCRALAVQGLALQRAFARLECPATRVRIVQLVETMASEQARQRR